MDTLTEKQRSYCMSQIKGRDTRIEVAFRKYIRKIGLKGWRTRNSLPGKPDLYFSEKKIAVFIDGCFWHKCPRCFVRPKSKNKYWDKKIRKNIGRDKKINLELKKRGVAVIRFWEHEIKKDVDKCYSKLEKTYEETKNN